MHKQRLAVMIAAGLGVIGVFMPWVVSESITIFGSTIPGVSYNGMDLNGWIPLLLAVAAGVFAFLGDDREKAIDANFVKIVAGTGAGIVLFMLYIWIMGRGLSIGVYLTLLAGLAILAVPFVIKDSGEFEMPTKDSIKDEFNEMKDN